MAEYEKYQQKDFDGDQINPSMIHEQLRAHDKRMRGQRDQWALIKAAYTTNSSSFIVSRFRGKGWLLRWSRKSVGPSLDEGHSILGNGFRFGCWRPRR